MLLLSKQEYKNYLAKNYETINKELWNYYSFYIKIQIINWEVILSKKSNNDNDIFDYNEYEDSIELIDHYLKKYHNVFLVTDSRKQYLLDTIKRIWDIENSEKLLIETIQKWYIN